MKSPRPGKKRARHKSDLPIGGKIEILATDPAAGVSRDDFVKWLRGFGYYPQQNIEYLWGPSMSSIKKARSKEDNSPITREVTRRLGQALALL